MKKIYLQKAFGFVASLILICAYSSCSKLAESNNITPGPSIVVSTLAGGGMGDPATITSPVYGRIGSADGTGTAASFYAPAGVVVDAAGNLYVTETGNHIIRKVTPAGVVTKFAGNLAGGSANGTGSAASFSGMQGLAIDAGGNLYIADSGNQMIRKVTPAGVVTTFAGTGVPGAQNGPAASATFNAPTGVAFDGTGNLLVADFGNKMIRKITPAGIVSTVAGNGNVGYANGPGASATFTSPSRLTADAAGNVYVADFKMVRKITPDGTVATLAGNNADTTVVYSPPVDGKGSAASFTVLAGITIDAAGNLYAGDNTRVRLITPDGTVSTLAGGGTGNTIDGPAKLASFGIMRGIIVNPSGNMIYVADYLTSLIRKIQVQ
jgi:sugar lactone lactonase YvrE